MQPCGTQTNGLQYLLPVFQKNLSLTTLSTKQQQVIAPWQWPHAGHMHPHNPLITLHIQKISEIVWLQVLSCQVLYPLTPVGSYIVLDTSQNKFFRIHAAMFRETTKNFKPNPYTTNPQYSWPPPPQSGNNNKSIRLTRSVIIVVLLRLYSLKFLTAIEHNMKKYPSHTHTVLSYM